MRSIPQTLALLLAACCIIVVVGGQTISQPPATLPVQSYSDDPSITTGSAYSAALCSLQGILSTESAAHGIGPLTVQPGCVSMTLQPHSSATVNGQTLPSSGVATIFSPSGSASASTSPTSAPRASSTSSSTSSAGGSSTSAPAPRQTNAGQVSRPPAAASWIAKHNIAVLLITTFALLAGVTCFLDELLTLLV